VEDDWTEHFVRAGHTGARPLASGAEGVVHRLGDGTVAKVWTRRRPAELRPWTAFYADVAAAGLPFATPVILRVDEIRGRAVTVERELPGTPAPPSPTTARTGTSPGARASSRRRGSAGCWGCSPPIPAAMPKP
jgi:hypothetical protein